MVTPKIVTRSADSFLLLDLRGLTELTLLLRGENESREEALRGDFSEDFLGDLVGDLFGDLLGELCMECDEVNDIARERRACSLCALNFFLQHPRKNT